MTTLITRIIIQDIVVIIVKNIDMFLRFLIRHTSMVNTKGGWVKPHVLAIWRLIILLGIIQQSQGHQVVNQTKEKARKILNTSKLRWTRHGRKKMDAT